MIFEYPEEFVVPIVYSEDLKEKSMNRNFGFKYLEADKIFMPDEKFKEIEIFKIDKHKYENASNKGMGLLNLDENSFEENYYEEDVSNNKNNENLIEYDYFKHIFNQIDDDYADNETLRS